MSRKYDREFKLNAVNLHREGKKSIKDLSQDLGIPLGTLTHWIREFKLSGEKGFVGSGNIKPQHEEIYQLKKELACVKQERDILKKAMAIFSKARG